MLPLWILVACGDPPKADDSGVVIDDDDCDADVEGIQSLMTLYADQDGDGFTVADGVELCVDEVPSGYLTEATTLVDCDDTSASVNPLATEIPGDDIDQDCDGEDPEPLPDDVFYVDIADPDCRDDLPGTVDTPNCTIVGAAALTADGDTVWVASDGEYPGQRLPAGRNYLGGFDASAGWVRDTAAHPTIVNQTWVEPEEVVDGVWSMSSTAAMQISGETTADTLVEGFDLRGYREAWGLSEGLSVFLPGGEVTVRDCKITAGGQESPTDVPLVTGTRGFSSFLALVHVEDSVIDGGGGIDCAAMTHSGTDSTVQTTTFRGCDGSADARGISVGSGSLVVSDSVIEIGTDGAAVTGIDVNGTGRLFATATIVRAHGTTASTALSVNGKDARVESKNSVFLASKTGATQGRGAWVQDYGTLLAASSLFDGGVAEDAVAVEALTGTLTLVNGLLDGGDSTDGSSAAVRVSDLTEAYLVANNLWGEQQDALLDQNGSLVTTPTEVNGCGWAGCKESRLNTSADPEFEDPTGEAFSVDPTSPAVDSGIDPSPYGLVVSRDLVGDVVPSDGDGDSVPEFDRGPHER